MLCHKCGKEIADDSMFCGYCMAPTGIGAPAPLGKPPITIELDKTTYNVGEQFIVVVRFLKDGVPTEPSEKKIIINRPDGSVSDWTPDFIRMDTGVYGAKTTVQQPAGVRVLNVSATVDGFGVSASKQYNVESKQSFYKRNTILYWGLALLVIVMILILYVYFTFFPLL